MCARSLSWRPADRDAPRSHRRYTTLAADGPNVLGPVVAAVGGNARRLSLAEFGFSSLQDWGVGAEPPTQFSMGLGRLDLGVPISLPLRAIRDEACESQHRVTPAKLNHFATVDPRTFAALLHNVEGGVEGYGARKLFCGYGG